ncbi:hypothetical protein [Acanthopleuribacter pedis]|uniref:WGR domain-containing protein n=1 Tax=Acanthopleuribacter pedis TaxID=442870 RepID=A0A8J7U0L7_9BACT|nr:hypothetical protein [Acanthopleuribacter pedis]MBO1317208.1 hypothetical protein [Acanthopleuribacter pedis]MBO1318514.1 hypothetical protein [Acanthopleuribacter pedis]
MKLERQTRLFFRKGASDKVYEVDLCRVGEDAYVVNFRYGPSGGNLRHGSKTPLPVGLAEAETVFDKLVASKTKKGYQPLVDGPGAAEETQAADLPNLDQALSHGDRVILEQAFLAAQNLTRRGGRTLTRLLWRIGERRLDGAQAIIRPHLKSKDDRMVHTACWVIARCGYRELLPDLAPILQQKKRPAWLKVWIRETRFHLLSPEERAAAAEQFTAELPLEQAQALAAPDEVVAWFLKNFQSPNFEKSSLLHDLYHFDVPAYRPALLALLQNIPLEPPYWPHLRFIFKAAILREDWAVFAVLSHRIHTTKAKWAYGYATIDWDYINIYNEARKTTSRVGFTRETRKYLVKRSWRELTRAARDRPETFVQMAGQLLLQFRDSDNRNIPSRSMYQWETDQDRLIHYPPFADLFAFSMLLFGKSDRFEVIQDSARLRYTIDAYDGNRPAATRDQREEPYPELWDQFPHALVPLLDGAKHHEVHRFAVKALRANPSYHEAITDEHLAAWLGSAYEETQAFAVELIEKRLQPDPFPVAMLTTLLRAEVAAAHQLAADFMRAHPRPTRESAVLVVTAGIHAAAEVRRVIADVLAGGVLALPDQAQIGRTLLAALVGLAEDTPHALLDEAYNLFAGPLATYLRRIDLEQIMRLLEHPAAAVQGFAGRLLRDHETPAEEFPQQVFAALLDAEDPRVRAAGVTLVGKLPLETLLHRDSLVLAAVLSAHAPVRHAAVPLVERIAAAHRGFAVLLAQTLCRHLLRKVADETQHADLAHLLANPLKSALAEIEKDTVWKMSRSAYRFARQAAGEIVSQAWVPGELNVRDWVLLAHSDQQKLRDFGVGACRDFAPRLLDDLAEAVRLPDTDWEDTRDAAFVLFRAEPVFSALAPTHLVALCDSTRPEVRAFGYELLTARFEKGQGREFLLKLSEHPAADMQLLASNWLLDHAEPSAAGLRALQPYLTTVLMRVNRSRVAKTRIYAFLAEQVGGDRDRAEVVRDILAPISQTIAVGDRDRCMAILHQCATEYPECVGPVRVVAAPIRERRKRGV